MTLRGSVLKRSWEQSGGWRWNGRKVKQMKQRDLSGVRQCPAGVRGVVVASKPGNSGGAKALEEGMQSACGGQEDGWRDDQTTGIHTGDSAAGSTSRSCAPVMGQRKTVCLDSPHVDGSH